eukprot:UN13687
MIAKCFTYCKLLKKSKSLTKIILTKKICQRNFVIFLKRFLQKFL